MKKLFAGILVGLGLVFGAGLGNEVGEVCTANANHEDCIREGIIADETYMTYEEYYAFEEMIHDLYIEEYCVDYCEKCDEYYYDECFCESECEYDDCEHDYVIFIEDHYDMIMDEYEEVLRGISDEGTDSRVSEENDSEITICEF